MLLKKKTMKNSNEVIQSQFETLLQELEEKRLHKDPGFYESILNSDYGSLPSAGKGGGELKKSVTQKMVSEKEKKLKARLSVDSVDKMLQKPSDSKPQLKMNVKLAEKDPLEFINKVLQHHGQHV